MQTFSPWRSRLGSHKRWVLLCAAGQAFSFAPLAGGGRRAISTAGILIVAAVYWEAVWPSARPGIPGWALVPRPLRAHFFAYRTRMMQLAVLAGFVVGGCWQWASHRGAPRTPSP